MVAKRSYWCGLAELDFPDVAPWLFLQTINMGALNTGNGWTRAVMAVILMFALLGSGMIRQIGAAHGTLPHSMLQESWKSEEKSLTVLNAMR